MSSGVVEERCDRIENSRRSFARSQRVRSEWLSMEEKSYECVVREEEEKKTNIRRG